MLLNNQALLKVYKSLSGRIRRARYLANISHERWNQAMKEHEKILSALDDRDGVKLGHLLKLHLLNKIEAIKLALHTDESE